MFALQEGRVIVTQDSDFLRFQASGRRHAGIAYVPQRTPIGVILHGLMLIHDALTADEMGNRVEFL